MSLRSPISSVDILEALTGGETLKWTGKHDGDWQGAEMGRKGGKNGK
jgi:hypothetical protein